MLNRMSEYFQKAMKHFRDKWENVTFLVFSDNLSWCGRQSLFEADNVQVIKGHSENAVTHDLAIMSACDGVILSLGTFGWWAGHFRVAIQIHTGCLFKRKDICGLRSSNDVRQGTI